MLSSMLRGRGSYCYDFHLNIDKIPLFLRDLHTLQAVIKRESLSTIITGKLVYTRAQNAMKYTFDFDNMSSKQLIIN